MINSSQFIKKCIKQKSAENKNNCNCYQLAPFRYVDGILFLSREETLRIDGTITMELIREKIPEIQVVSSLELLQYDYLTPDSEIYQIIYSVNLEMTNAKAWYRLLPEADFLDLSKSECEVLLNYNNLEEIQNIIIKLTECMKNIPGPYFVKTGLCSTKKNIQPRPVFDAKDALYHLLSSNNVKQSLENGKCKGILVQPWRTDINPNVEFRVFVRSGVVTAASQQYLYEIYPIMYYWEAETVILAFQTLWDSFKDRLPENLTIRDSVFDGYLTTTIDGEVIAHLIEINSGAFGWGPAGSALFDWEYEPPPQIGEPRELRVTV